MSAYKVASPITIGFQSLIKAMAHKNKPIIMSTGYCTIPEISRAVETVAQSDNKQLLLLHCSASYPILSMENVNLSFMKFLERKYHCLVGFSDHTMSTFIPAIAVALGARVIEKHFTISRKLKGPDHKFALEPKELKEMVKNIRDAEKIMGNKKVIFPFESKMKKIVMMKLVVARDLSAGEVLASNDIIFRRSPGGIEEFELNKIIGKKLVRPLKKMTLINKKDIK